MKKITLFLAPLLFLVGLQAKPTQAIPQEEAYTIKTGTTMGHYQKPGAPIDMTYKSEKVDVNQTADINITLSTSVQYGTMSVSLKIDDKLTQETEVQENLTFDIQPNKKTFEIHLKVRGEEEGLYYIRLLCKNDKSSSSRMRAFAVPVYIGEDPKPKSKGILMKAMSGENLSISKAVETIRTLDE